jgi:hypothetical protein
METGKFAFIKKKTTFFYAKKSESEFKTSEKNSQENEEVLSPASL